MVSIATINVNGIRAACRKGFHEWLQEADADIICLQEVRAGADDPHVQVDFFPGYQGYFSIAEKKGYSGVGILSKIPAVQVVTSCGLPFADEEGRFLWVDFGDFAVASLYLPSGTQGEVRQALKYQWLDFFYDHVFSQPWAQRTVFCGDWNIAHQVLDLKNWKNNQKNSGFLPEERQWLDKLYAHGWVDAYRHLHPQTPGYTWWTYRAGAFERDVGWRIDLQVIPKSIEHTLCAARVDRTRFSDHAPLVVDYDFASLSS